jgi:hypothetical protein
VDSKKENRLAVWILTPNGSRLAEKIMHGLPDVDGFVSPRIAGASADWHTFQNLAADVKQKFRLYALDSA